MPRPADLRDKRGYDRRRALLRLGKRYRTIRPGQETAFYNRVDNKWITQSSIINSELIVYFPRTTLPSDWSAYNSAVLTYLDDQLNGGGLLTSSSETLP
jgi:hypothetical protein